MEAFMQGLLMTAGLIAAIGAQNVFVLQQGAARRHVAPVVALCVASDWLLIMLGVFGFGALVQAQPGLLELLRYGGAAFVAAYGLAAARRALRGARGLQAGAAGGASRTAVLGTALAITYLNPHVYLDTVVLLGSVGAQQPAALRPAFAAGAALASLLWFAGLGYGAMLLSRWLARPAAWRLIDSGVALFMFWIALQLLLPP